MFSNKAQLQKRTPENGNDRESFLSLLVDEYLNSSSYDAKSQVLANLANFAYDPINYEYIRNVGVLDIFLYVIEKETDTKLLQFASGGICNLVLDPLNAEYILNHLGINSIVNLLKLEHSDIIANSITTLIYLFNQHTQQDINTPEIKTIVKELSKSEDKMVSNVAMIFLQDICQQSE